MVATLVLEASAVRRESSSLSLRTTLVKAYSSSGQDAGFSSRKEEFDSLIGYQPKY